MNFGLPRRKIHDYLILNKKESVEVWNEAALKINALSVIFRLAELNHPPVIKTFFERPIHKKVGNYTISVMVDLMLAAVLGKGRFRGCKK